MGIVLPASGGLEQYGGCALVADTRNVSMTFNDVTANQVGYVGGQVCVATSADRMGHSSLPFVSMGEYWYIFNGVELQAADVSYAFTSQNVRFYWVNSGWC